jgi:hypothetical protein
MHRVSISVKATSNESIGCLITLTDEGMTLKDLDSCCPSKDTCKEGRVKRDIRVSREGRVQGKKFDLRRG